MSFFSASTALRSGFAALRTNPLRTVLSALGVVIGIGAMIAVLALSDGVETSIRGRLAADGRMLMLRVEPKTSERVDGLSMPRRDVVVFHSSAADSLATAVGRLGTVDLSAVGPAFVEMDGAQRRGVPLRGMRLAPPQLRDRPPAAGRFYTPEEGRAGARVLVLSDALAAALAQSARDSGATRPRPTAAACRALVGRSVTVGGEPWQIVGILQPPEETPTACTGKPPAPRLAGMPPMLAAPSAMAPTDAALRSMVPIPGRPVTPALVIVAHRIEDLPAVRAIVERWLASRYGTPTGTGAAAAGGWRDQIDVASYERESDGIRQAMLVFRLLMSAITGISLVVGGVGIMNVLLATVTERTREIGISKAVGARRRDVLVQYLAESVAISLMGAAFGTALGYAVAQIVAAVMRARVAMPVHAGFSVSTMLVAIGAPLIVGLTFGMYPALRASRLSPIDAIRHE